MFNRDTEVLFPNRLLSQLTALQQPAWQSLLLLIQGAQPTSPESIAFTLMMTRLCGCESCQLDSHRGLRGCSECAIQTVQRTALAPHELQERFEQALAEVIQFLADPKPNLAGKAQ